MCAEEAYFRTPGRHSSQSHLFLQVLPQNAQFSPFVQMRQTWWHLFLIFHRHCLLFAPGILTCRWGSPFGPHVCAPWKLRRVNVHGITLNQWGGEREQKHQCFLLVLRCISLDSRVVLLVWAYRLQQLAISMMQPCTGFPSFPDSLFLDLTLALWDHICTYTADMQTFVSDSASFCFGGARAKNTEQNKEFGRGCKTNARVIW